MGKSRCVLEVRRARILLLRHEDVGAAEVARMIGCARATVYRTAYRSAKPAVDADLEKLQRETFGYFVCRICSYFPNQARARYQHD